MSTLKLKKQLSLLVFIPFLFVSSYTNTYNKLPIIYVNHFITEIDFEGVGLSKKVGEVSKTVKKFVNDLVSKFLNNTKVNFVNLRYIETFQKTIVGDKAVVLNRGSPVLN